MLRVPIRYLLNGIVYILDTVQFKVTNCNISNFLNYTISDKLTKLVWFKTDELHLFYTTILCMTIYLKKYKSKASLD